MDKNTKRAVEGYGGSGRQARPQSKGPRRHKTTQRASNKPVRQSDRADKVIAFIERLTIPSGVGQGGPFILREWQRRFIRDIYEPQIDGRRCVRRAILSVARKNGKTALIAALALAH